MSKHITFAQHGQQFAVGRGKGFFGIWRVNDRQPVLVERWPETPDGWYGAWARFTMLEQHPELAATATATSTATPSTPPPRVGFGSRAGGGRSSWPIAFLAVGLFCGVVALFAPYLGGVALTAENSQLVPHVLYLATWLVAGALLASPRTASGGRCSASA